MWKCEAIKLIVWDLDETLWQGTLSEGDVLLSDTTVRFLEACLDRGIVHSICSKNDYNHAKKALSERKVWDDFVFPSINWEAKGARLKQLIEDMALRPANVLFVDDNVSNLNEAIYFCPEIMTATAEELADVMKGVNALAATDTTHKRHRQYQLLEAKHVEKGQFSSNEEFLFSSEIQVEINYQCEEHLPRIADLIQRSNQLNYTKNRMSEEELKTLLREEGVRCGCVSVKDKFGDYGIVGFFAIRGQEAIHFTFSCRTLGMRVEQWTYMQVGCPTIQVVGEVVCPLNTGELPGWINHTPAGGNAAKEEKFQLEGRVLFKGPCDMSQMFSFIKENKKSLTEFTYVGSSHQSVEGHNTTAQLLSALTLTEAEKEAIVASYSWFDEAMYDTALCREDVPYFIFSLLSDGNLGIYRSKSGGHYVALCEGYYDLTDEANWDAYIQGSIFTSAISFTREDLQRFAQEYEKMDNASAAVTMQCLDSIYEKVGKGMSKMILLLGSEKAFPYPLTSESYRDRHLFHQILNEQVRAWAADKPNVALLCFDRYIESNSDFLDTINHFSKRVYYELAQDIVAALEVDSLAPKSKLAYLKQALIQKLRKSRGLRKIRNLLRGKW